jgi:toxin ParE1/3/4
MAYALKFRKLAIKDIGEAFDWYEARKIGLGEEFLLSTELAFDDIRRNPEYFEEKYPNVRRYNLRRFPYSVYYRILKKQVAILAVYHQSRNPRRWQKRRRKS